MMLALVLVGILVVIVASVWAARRVRHPEHAASHGVDARETTSERFYSGTDRPAGPDAEDPAGGAIRFDGDAG